MSEQLNPSTLVDPTTILRVSEQQAAEVRSQAQTQPQAQAQALPTQTRVQADDLPPAALKDRLDQARRKEREDLLARYGARRPEDLDAQLKRLKELEDAALSDKERTERQIAELRVQAAERDRYQKLFSEQTAASLSTLSEEQRSAVNAYAGEDPIEQHRMIQAFRMASLAAGAPQQTAPTVPLVIPQDSPPATTVPAGTPPAPASHVKTKAQEWAELRQVDPIAGALLHQRHAREIHGDNRG